VSAASQPPEAAADAQRRFGGVARLYGAAALERFAIARVGVVGLGGVGTWAAEALARSGVAHLRLIDLDHVSESNTNRQVHALDGEYGRAKVQSMAERVAAIHPLAQVETVEDFVTAHNAGELLAGLDLVVDCIDQAAAKAAMVAWARHRGLPIVVCGAAGGRRDPVRIRREDLARTRGDALLARVRQRLRQEYGFPAAGRGRQAPRFGVEAIYSDEPALMQPACAPDEAPPGSPLACGGYGSAVTVTAAMGLAAAAHALTLLTAEDSLADSAGTRGAL
jgi:tRNA A37 threonylcarbamoyladenosine dehydratase